MSDQPVPPPAPSTKSLDDILNQLEKSSGTPSSANEPAPMIPVVTNQNPILSSTSTPASNPEEKALPVVESAAIPAQPTPVATLAENPIPVPPPPVHTEAAPMVKEEPILDKKDAVVTAAPATPTPTETATTSSGSKGKVIAGIIGVFLLLGALGAGTYFIQYQQNTRGSAYASPTPLPQTRVMIPASPAPQLATPIPLTKLPVTVNVCVPTGTKLPGNLLFFNTTDKKFTVQSVDPKATSVKATVPPGTYVVIYQSNDTVSTLGFTDATHKLQSFVVSVSSTSQISVCDKAVVKTSIPSIPNEGYALYQ